MKRPSKSKSTKASAKPHSKRGYTLADYFNALTNGNWSRPDFILWPPDVFAISASVLAQTGAYRILFDYWRPCEDTLFLQQTNLTNDPREAKEWEDLIRLSGKCWASIAALRSSQKSAKLPKKLESETDFYFISSWWKHLGDVAQSVTLRGIQKAVDSFQTAADKNEMRPERELILALIQLVAAADESCSGAGFRNSDHATERQSFLTDCLLELVKDRENEEPDTLCSDLVESTRVVVLPKGRTAQVGATLRSITHNIALCPVNEVLPRWHVLPDVTLKQQDGNHKLLSLLVLPWPDELTSGNIAARDKRQCPVAMSDSFGFFEFSPPRVDADYIGKLSKVIEKAEKEIGRKLDGVVLPELALHRDDYARVLHCIKGAGIPIFISGVGCTSNNGSCLGVNKALLWWGDDNTIITQHKHHRWMVDENQSTSMGLLNKLHPNTNWWEGHTIEKRELTFFVLGDSGVVMSMLICEDLARQDPVSEIVRSVGPSFVIALLLDGPQTINRWPARYATVLAEDPGSSVLTITSLGMIKMSPLYEQKRNRAVCLWKESGKQDQELSLDESAVGLVLGLAVRPKTEYSADGRSDGNRTSHISLVDVKQISV